MLGDRCSKQPISEIAPTIYDIHQIDVAERGADAKRIDAFGGGFVIAIRQTRPVIPEEAQRGRKLRFLDLSVD